MSSSAPSSNPSSSSSSPSSSSASSSSGPSHHSAHHDTNSTPPPTSTPSSSTLHPLLPPIHPPPTGPGVLAAEIDRYAIHRDLYAQSQPRSNIPEKCFTFCNQRADTAPVCRSFCLRKRSILNTQAEDLAKLRPPKRHDTVTATAGLSIKKTEESQSGGWFSWSPFEALKRRLDPYSIVYIKGTPDGVVGRYMEEMEYDDGQYDFGAISRGAGSLAKRRREENRWEWLDWGDHGSLLYLPLTSLFYPILSIPQTLDRVFSPSKMFLTRYAESFNDGTQIRAYERFKEEATNGGAGKLLMSVRGHWAKQVQERIDELEREKSEKMDKMRKMGKDLDGKEVD